MHSLDPRSDDDVNSNVSSLYVEIIDKNRSYYKCTICGGKLSRKQNSKPTLCKLGCCADICKNYKNYSLAGKHSHIKTKTIKIADEIIFFNTA